MGGGLTGRPGLAGADRPRLPALPGKHALGDDDLLLTGGAVGHVGELAAAEGPPGVRRELQPAVEAVAGVDAPVAAALALRDPIPRRVRCGVGRGGGGQEGNACDGPREGRAGDGPAGGAGRTVATAVASHGTTPGVAHRRSGAGAARAPLLSHALFVRQQGVPARRTGERCGAGAVPDLRRPGRPAGTLRAHPLRTKAARRSRHAEAPSPDERDRVMTRRRPGPDRDQPAVLKFALRVTYTTTARPTPDPRLLAPLADGAAVPSAGCRAAPLG